MLIPSIHKHHNQAAYILLLHFDQGPLNFLFGFEQNTVPSHFTRRFLFLASAATPLDRLAPRRLACTHKWRSRREMTQR